MLHHLQPEDSSDFDNVGLCLKEMYRALKPKGAIIINSCTPEQSATGFWFLQLNSELLQKKIGKRLVMCFYERVSGTGLTWASHSKHALCLPHPLSTNTCIGTCRLDVQGASSVTYCCCTDQLDRAEKWFFSHSESCIFPFGILKLLECKQVPPDCWW